MDLPDDVILEILIRFSLNQADGFLLQSPKSKSNAHLLSFVSPHPNNNSPPLNLSLNFLPGLNPQIRAVAPNGLLLCETQHSIRHNKRLIYTITKLSTQQWKGLPIPKTRYFTSNIAMYVLRSNPLHFKILRLSSDKIPSKRPLPFCYTICEVFDSESWRWKQLDDIVHYYCGKTEYVDSQRAPVFAYGLAHWKFRDDTSIFAFDFYSETWSKIAMPETIVNDKNNSSSSHFQRWHIELVEYEGKLGVVREFHKPTVFTELWVMENYGKKKMWMKKLDSSGSMPTTFYGSDIQMMWLHDDSSNVMFSNIETGERNYKKSEQSHRHLPMVFPFLSDFETWNFNPPPRSIKPKAVSKILRRNDRCKLEELNLTC
ncbi:F-box protein [Cucumis melo var. makuwa]|uniref:F-box protein n=1 Tax=Cucumis melo var. makuwa TaxID=1194695 RepID=A0A5A7TPP2_CUCMM|nr:F-box protein [Cucumis melo var. makuwa]